MMILTFLLLCIAIVCALQAIRTTYLLSASLWLASVSASIATVMYRLGAADVAVIELSVGAGLVTILFIFAITVAGDEVTSAPPVVPRLLSGLLTVSLIIVLGWLMKSSPETAVVETAVEPFTVVLWETRGLDVLVQIGLIFAGVMGVLGLLAEEHAVVRDPQTQPATPPVGVNHSLAASAKEKTGWMSQTHS
ncbi:MAG: DUF4040 domain-containing protein [Anaerolineales bacterium]|nr:DUF4040 domain-containing protein [Anaerolineales bacterium]